MNQVEQTQAEQTVAIVGYGVAGVNAAIALRTHGFKDAIRAFSDIETRPYSPILTSYYVGGEKTYEQCFPWSEDELAALDVEVHAGHPVTALDPVAHTVATDEGVFSYDKCIIASGARAATFGFVQVEGYEPLVLRTLGDAQRMKAAFESESCKRVLVSGASMIALKVVEAALRLGLDVSLVGINPHVLDFNALPEAAARFEKGLRAQGVSLRFGDPIANVEVKDDGNVQGRLEVTFRSGDVAHFDETVVAHGVQSDFSYLPQGALAMDRAILVDDHMRTSDPDIYAAGDVAQAIERISGQQRVVGIWKSATAQGACAGAAIAAGLSGRDFDASDAYSGSLSTNTIAVNGTLFISAGSFETGEGRHVEVRENDDTTVICIYEGKRLVGFNVACDTDKAGSRAYDTAAMLTLRIEAGCR